MYRYCLFDLDGTLTDSSEGICKSIQYSLGKIGIQEDDLQKLEVFIGPPLRYSFKEYYGLEGELAEQAIAFYRERYTEVGKYENRPYPGIREMLIHLKAAGAVLAVASSKPELYVEDILRHFDLYELFDYVVGSDLEGKRETKTAVIREAMERMQVTREEQKGVLMVGDRHFDIDGAKELSLDSLGVYYGFAKSGELEAAGADYVVHTVDELEKLLLEKLV